MGEELVHIDIFSGVGGFSYGFGKSNLKVGHHYFSEIDKHAIAVYKYHFKNAEYVGSVIDVSGTELRRKHPNSKFIITFGFPCQDLSIAGKGLGFDGKRSVLFFEAMRIVEEVKPEVFVFENVKGLLSHNNGETFEIVLRTIANIGIYECEWQLLNTRWLLPQNRERIFFVGHLRERSKPGVFPFREDDFRSSQGSAEAATVRTLTAGGHSGGMHSGMTLISNSGLSRKFEEREILPPLRANTGVGSNDFIITPVTDPSRQHKKQNGRLIKEAGEPAFCLNTQDRHAVLIQRQDTKGMSQGNRIYKSEGIACTLSGSIGGLGGQTGLYDITSHHQRSSKKCNGGTGELTNSEFCYTIDSTPHTVNKIRRLTEIECERLQGFPDNWTKYGNYDGTIKEVSRTQRYKQMGNAITSLWATEIGNRLNLID